MALKSKRIRTGKVVDCAVLNVRLAPELMSEVVIVLMRGAEVDIVGNCSDDWYKVVTATGEIGYALKECIAVKG